MSMRSAITSPTTGQVPHTPPYKFCTAEYHSNVVGRKMNPISGQSRSTNIPLNQVVKNQSIATTSRGVISASSTMKQGTASLLGQFLCSYPSGV
jgi:hypothetical protein